VTAMGAASGKFVVTLGLVEMLARRVKAVGFFRPVVPRAPDNDVDLIRARYHLPDECVGYAFTGEEYRHFVADHGPVAAMERAVRRYKQIEAHCDVVVIEGSDFTGPDSPVELEANVRFARNLGAAVVAVVNGHDRTVDEIVDAAAVGQASVGDGLIALVVNRTNPELIAEVDAALARPATNGTVAADRRPAWAIPEDPALRQPSVEQLAARLGGTWITGSADDLQRPVRSIRVAAMSVPNLLDRFTEGTLLIAPGDRPEVIMSAALSRASDAYSTVVGVALSGGLVPDERVLRLVDGVGGGTTLPMFVVDTDSFETAVRASHIEGSITPDNTRKVEAALGLFEAHIDVAALAEGVELARPDTVTPIMFQYDLIERAQAANAHIVLPEGVDDRVLIAADRVLRRRVCDLTLLGPVDRVRARIAELGLDLDVPVIDPLDSELLDRFALRYHELRGHKGITLDKARDIMTDVSYFGTMMVQEGLADGMVSGAAHTTAHTIRPALEFVKTRPGTSIVSSCFLMLLSDRVLVYGDCAVNPDPNADELADIAISSADTAALFGIEPRVAMLSYSTGDSSGGADVEKVRAATEFVRQRRPDLLVEGPIQYDAAIDPEVGRAKLPGSEVAGRATVFVFPDLNTGNNTYKAVQRSADAIAVGPILQGLAKPVNDLSRGALVPDIVNTIAITAIQAGRG
jgi:phosphate acetyltransferase